MLSYKISSLQVTPFGNNIFYPLRPAFQGHSRSLEPTPSDDRLTVTFYYRSIVNMGLSRTVSELKGDNCRISSTPVYLTPAEGFPWEFCNGSGSKTRMMSLPYRRKNIAVCPFIWTQCRYWCDRRKDRQTGGHIRHNNIVPCMHCMLTRIKKRNYCLIAAVYLKG